MPRPRVRVAGQKRGCEAMDAQEGAAACPHFVEGGVDSIVIGLETTRDTIGALVHVQPDIAGNDRAVTGIENGRLRVWRSIGVDDQARIARQQSGCIEARCQLQCDSPSARVPGDVPVKLAGIQTQVAQLRRHGVHCMIADEQGREAAAGVDALEGPKAVVGVGHAPFSAWATLS